MHMLVKVGRVEARQDMQRLYARGGDSVKRFLQAACVMSGASRYRTRLEVHVARTLTVPGPGVTT